ncbi:energy transducer TonB [Adhaeribacter aquaticus]|uniref:energy transducer TonB n=1 Tax=Adhaeribacter aquaticus TaxID=299567 RepID=UPI00047E07CE|nr:energy transducer TonB [Adhaeribacter aquaticus]
MRILSCILLLMLSKPVLGQELVPKSKKLTRPFIGEEYYVLKSDPTIKQGEYKRFFSSRPGALAIKGQYQEDTKVGTWEYYDPFNGGLVQQYNFTENKLEFTTPLKALQKIAVEENGQFIEKEPDEVPYFIGGDSFLYGYLGANTMFPTEALRRHFSGSVFVTALVTKDGQLIDEKVEEDPGMGLKEEALRVAKLLPDEFIPAKMMGEPVNTRVTFEMRFRFMPSR